MVCELQLLLKTMIIAKKRDHALYEIKRTKESREKVWKLSNLYSSLKEELFAIAMREDVKELERFMINHPKVDYLAMRDENGSSLIHFIAQKGNVKMMNFLFSFIPSSKMEERVNLRGCGGRTALMFAVDGNHLEMVKVKLLRKRVLYARARNNAPFFFFT